MWTGHNLLHVKPILAPTGSGDTLYDWTQLVTMLGLAAVATVLWSLVARDTPQHERLHKWFRLFLRVALGTTMLSYGFAKVFPLQMPTIFLSRLLEPYGNFSPMGVIWYSIGASPGYERFIGFAEVLGGTLLFLPWTALLGVTRVAHRHDRRLHRQHDVRRPGQAVLVSSRPDVDLPHRAVRRAPTRASWC